MQNCGLNIEVGVFYIVFTIYLRKDFRFLVVLFSDFYIQ